MRRFHKGKPFHVGPFQGQGLPSVDLEKNPRGGTANERQAIYIAIGTILYRFPQSKDLSWPDFLQD